MKREQLLAAMSRKLGRPMSTAPAPPRWRPPEELFVVEADERRARLLESLGLLGVHAETVTSREEAQQAVERLASQRGWVRLACPFDLAWRSLLPLLGQDDASLPFGLVEAEWALAETGTIVVYPGSTQRRTMSLLPPAVGFLVRRSRIVSRLTDLFERLDADPGSLPANAVLISGPSRSADIGSVVCRGVHGPGEVHVWIIDSE